jgi:hypothetical protein
MTCRMVLMTSYVISTSRSLFTAENLALSMPETLSSLHAPLARALVVRRVNLDMSMPDASSEVAWTPKEDPLEPPTTLLGPLLEPPPFTPLWPPCSPPLRSLWIDTLSVVPSSAPSSPPPRRRSS